MAKQIKETAPAPEIKVKIEPVVKASAPYFPVKPGHYHLVKLDKTGNEILGTDVQVSERTFNRTFSKLIGTQYEVKKNPQK